VVSITHVKSRLSKACFFFLKEPPALADGLRTYDISKYRYLLYIPY